MVDDTAAKPLDRSTTPDETAAHAPGAFSLPEAAQPKPRRRKRWPWVLGGLGVLVALFLFFLGSVTMLEYTESTPFCSLCHVMYPERTAYDGSPHSRVECGKCHVGPGAVPAVQAKLAAVRYLWVYPLNLYERPIPTPIKSLRPTTVVCEQCHWPQKFYENRLLVIPDYAQDDKNSLTRTELLLKTGGGSQETGLGRGIHWHIENPVYYIATDEKRQNIPWVQAEYNGQVTGIPVDRQHLDAGRDRQGREAQDGLRGLPQPCDPHLPQPRRLYRCRDGRRQHRGRFAVHQAVRR